MTFSKHIGNCKGENLPEANIPYAPEHTVSLPFPITLFFYKINSP